MKNFYFTLFLTLFTTCLFAQDEEMELIPGAVVGSCIEPDSNLIILYFDYNKNCPDADPTGVLAGAPLLGFHSGINGWSVSVPFDDANVMNVPNIGNDIFSIRINTMDYYNTALSDIETIHFIFNNGAADPNNAWAVSGRDDQGGGGFGNDEPCNDFVINIANMPVCSEVEAESSVSLMGPTTAANSCINAEAGTVTIQFDNSLNCPEADGDGVIAGAAALGFHSGANDWASTVEWDAEGAMQATNNGNDIFSVTVDPMAYYGVPLADLENIILVMNNGVANPGDAWAATGKDERDGGFGGAEPCSDLVFAVSEAGACPVIVEVASSDAVLNVSGDVSTCIDPARGKVRISFDLSQNCPEADPDGMLKGLDALGFHSGANNWANTVAWDADNAVQAMNNGSDIFTLTINVEEYYGIPFDSLKNIEFLLNNGPNDEENAWVLTGKDHRDGGGFGNEEPCSNLLLDISEADQCELKDVLSTQELVTGLAMSCVDAASGRIRVDFDRNQNCAEADTANQLGDQIVLHSGVNGWNIQVPWDNENSKKPSNDGNGLYSTVIDVKEYYGISIDSITEVNFLYNNGVAAPDDAWAVTGKATTGAGGFGGGDPCGNFLMVLSEMPTCNLADKLSSNELFNGLAMPCVDANLGKIRLDFDRNQNCAEADPENILGDTIIFHSGVNGWMNQVAWDSENVMKPSNDGNGLYSMTFNVEDYYGVPMDSITEINFLYNNGVAAPDDAWTITGKAATGGGGFGGDEPCGNFLFVLSEAPACDLSLSSKELLGGLAASCVDEASGRIRLDFDRNQNCTDADPENMLGEQIILHSGVNGWSTQVPWDSENVAKPSNDGSGLYRTVIDVEAYYGVPMSEVTEVNFLYNNGVAAPTDAWTLTGKATAEGSGFGGDESCGNFLFVLSEAPSCDLADKVSSSALISGLASSCMDPSTGNIRIDFDMALNCSEADPGNLLVGAAQIGFHSGINGWETSTPWDDEKAKAAVNNGENLFSVTVNAMDYYGVPLSQIGEINFLMNNGFGGDGVDPWANTGKDETGMGGFGGDELCDNLLFATSTAATCDLSTSTLDLNLDRSMKVMPNPFSSQVLIQFDNPSNKDYELIINDLSGRVVQRITGLTGNQVTVQRNDMPAGLYIAQLRDEAGNFATTKLVVE